MLAEQADRAQELVQAQYETLSLLEKRYASALATPPVDTHPSVEPPSLRLEQQRALVQQLNTAVAQGLASGLDTESLRTNAARLPVEQKLLVQLEAEARTVQVQARQGGQAVRGQRTPEIALLEESLKREHAKLKDFDRLRLDLARRLAEYDSATSALEQKIRALLDRA